MKDRRFVDELGLEELERLLLIKRREARHARLRQMGHAAHVSGRDPLESAPPSSIPPIPTDHLKFQGVGASASYQSNESHDDNQRTLWSGLARWLSAPLNINWRFVFSGLLFMVEIAAVVGLIAVVANAWQDREKIDVEVEEIAVTPSATAAVQQVRAVLLPGGHTSPDSRGFSQPEQIPEHLRALALTITPQPIPTHSPEHASRIVIPAIDVDHPVVEGDDWETLKRGVGHTPWSSNPGKVGNCVLSAHNDIYGGIFRRLPDLELDDEIFIHTSYQIYRYIVKATRIVDPTQVDIMNPTDYPALTLISSYPYLENNQRIVVIAELASSQ
jgi:sortase A